MSQRACVGNRSAILVQEMLTFSHFSFASARIWMVHMGSIPLKSGDSERIGARPPLPTGPTPDPYATQRAPLGHRNSSSTGSAQGPLSPQAPPPIPTQPDVPSPWDTAIPHRRAQVGIGGAGGWEGALRRSCRGLAARTFNRRCCAHVTGSGRLGFASQYQARSDEAEETKNGTNNSDSYCDRSGVLCTLRLIL